MIRDHFRVMRVDLAMGRGEIQTIEGRDLYAGGSGLAALLFSKFAHPDKAWDDPDQPLILAIGPLTGLFPLMSKTVCAFKSPYHDQYAESHAQSVISLCAAVLGIPSAGSAVPVPLALRQETAYAPVEAQGETP